MATRDTVLVVEDDPDLAAALTGMLTDEGHRVIAADSAAEALRLLRAFRVQLVLTDALWHDRAADRWAAVDAIRAAASDAPIILCSGHGTRHYADHAAHGCAAFLAKPFDIEELLRVVATLLPGSCGSHPQGHGHPLEQLV